MRRARTVPIQGHGNKAYCATEDDDLIPPGMRLLLNSFAPRQIKAIESDYDATAWETAALGLLTNEDAGTKISFKKNAPVEQGTVFHLKVKEGHGLMPGHVELRAGALNMGSPNVDITQRIPPAELSAPHTGVHNVHRLYLSAAFRLLFGESLGNNTGVGALIVSPLGEILAWGKKSSAHPLLHAETSALLMYGENLPRGARIYSTLKPCKMCRAAIEHFSTDDDFLSYYGQDDPTNAATGGDVTKYVLMASATSVGERPIWADNKKGTDIRLRTSVTQNLNNNFRSERDRQWNLGIIDFIKDGGKKKNQTMLRTAADYLEVKQRKYSDPKLSDLHNKNVEKCLDHIAQVMTQLGIPLPPRK
ncbi:hypothetical protein CI15_32230 [Paraburkholderia monticola]|uniref:CMP/dCMP-type deaminase domain-containing protein n=1 Tax=Paraburkholderia monticola TaxID=1399968 RepID=A0A149PB40_9BURK|nr:Bd3614 family nucleic acid deaminase [Paraburkholderia monticola]KXU82233.1 hypothetical protein CI15_32230 [Paraburkholderia monticola]